ncbi:MAG: acyl-protein synthetase [Lachnospiraceae bacterium]|nr:acyl-protein synthetase [Lachnospiraceae bacterium]
MIEEFYKRNPYELTSEKKESLLRKELAELTEFHKKNCKEYERFLKAAGYKQENIKRVEDIPFYPVRMFKKYDLKSIDEKEVFKVMTSSGTTGQAVSKIYLNQETAMMQQKVMIKILNDFWGKKRLPMMIVDSPAVVKNRKLFSARGAAVIGLRMASSDMVYILNDDMSLNIEKLKDFLEKYQGQRFVIFGFTSIVWRHFYQELKKRNEKENMPQAVLMTGGGWKKLEKESVTRDEFKKEIHEFCGINYFLDHYGMVEQTGCIYAECEYGHLHASIYSDVIVRDYKDYSPCVIGKPGILQVVSVLPRSYPGHSLLTEDEGVVLGEDDCPCGRKGKYIKVFGRMKDAELRGCSDTYAT